MQVCHFVVQVDLKIKVKLNRSTHRDNNGTRIGQIKRIQTDFTSKSFFIRLNLSNPCPILVAVGGQKGCLSFYK